MKIYLDSKDHIRLVDRKSLDDMNSFKGLLEATGSSLVFSMHNIAECCTPLLMSKGSNVMRLLNRLEDMPHGYIAEASIPAKELKEAGDAFSEGREYGCIDPYVKRFDYVVSPFQRPVTSDYLKFGLSQAVYELWSEDPSLFDGYRDGKLRDTMAIDRKRKDFKDHDANFVNTVIRDLSLYNISFPKDTVTALASWIYEKPVRCPGFRLGYEVFHKLLKNVTDAANASDIPDFAHVDCIPYIDLITLDNRMRGYVAQADNSLGTNYSKQVYKGIKEIEQSLKETAAEHEV